MVWKIEWRKKDGVAIHSTGPTFLVTRSGWVMVRDTAGQSDEDLKLLMRELHDLLENVSQDGDAIH